MKAYPYFKDSIDAVGYDTRPNPEIADFFQLVLENPINAETNKQHRKLIAFNRAFCDRSGYQLMNKSGDKMHTLANRLFNAIHLN